jgi:hypothetical protein
MTGLDGGHQWDSQGHVKRDVRLSPQRAPLCTGTSASGCYTVDNYLYGFKRGQCRKSRTQLHDSDIAGLSKWAVLAGKIVNHHIPYNLSAISRFMLYLDKQTEPATWQQALKGHAGVQGFKAARVPQEIMDADLIKYYLPRRDV